MNLNQSVVGNSIPAQVPTQEPVAVVLEHAMKQAEIALNHIDTIVNHVGGPMSTQSDEPSVPGVMGKAFALRTQLQKINGKLESLAALL